ncbi:MAG: SusD/RagB family nutrient-binding outer membrane lipoprotein [Prevotella sp.]|nr:SusD/RagB family nutrient-binding outer membrane lipoprotein [Prevotella sp.]
MKLNKFFIAGAMAAMLTLNISCADDYKELNQDPANVTKTMPEGLMTAAINAFQPTDYLVWFYNVQYFTRWDQMGMPGSGFDDSFTGVAETGGQGSQYIRTLKYRNRIQNYINETGEVENNGYLAATGIMTIYLGIFDTDMYGSIPYTEACHYDDQGILTPKYDSVEELYNLWITELDEYITMLKAEGLSGVTRQDAAYGCNWSKWAKLANSLKLKIAVRLYNNDPQKALAIAEEAASNSAGLITDIEDDFRFAKATDYASGNADYVYGTGNGLSTIYGTGNVIKFMLDSKDPRVRFIYTKNSYNSKVVQSFIDNGKYDDLPTAVKANVILDDEGNFKEWGGMGEPWVRYTALPVQYSPKTQHDAGFVSDEDYEEYWNPGLRYQIEMENAKGDKFQKSYNPWTSYTNELRRGRIDFQIPTAMTLEADGTIDMHVIQDTDDNPLYQMYLGAGEVDLYMAELALLKGGSIGGKSAEAWYEAGVRASVEEFDALAKDNKIPYYGTTYNYDENEKPIDLVEGEIEAMLATPNVKLTGSTSEKLEKVYLQQLIHFSEQCDDQFVTARRSGYPKVGSSLLPFVVFPNTEVTAIPRRFAFDVPEPTDIMGEIKNAAYKAQGIETLGANSMKAVGSNSPLNLERLWQDKNAPQWGSGK